MTRLYSYFVLGIMLLGWSACTATAVPSSTPVLTQAATLPTPSPVPTTRPTASPTVLSSATPTVMPTPVLLPTLPPANITVTTTDDENNHDGDCSLREAIRAANTDRAVDACAAGQGEDRISLPPGTYSLSVEGERREDEATSGDLDISTVVSIQGAGVEQVILDAAQLDRIFHVLPEGALTLSQLTMRNGETLGGGESGGEIFNVGTLAMTDCALIDNRAGGRGGGLYNTGQASLIRCTVSGNQDGSGGGGGSAITEMAPGAVVPGGKMDPVT